MTKAKTFGLALFGSAFICCVVVVGVKRHSDSKENLGTKFEPNRSFKGQIAVSLTERRDGPERKKLVFLIDLDRGEISQGAPQFKEPSSSGGRIDCRHQATEVIAPNRQRLANCTAEGEVQILKQGSNDPVQKWSAGEGWNICGLAWSLDSKAVAILLEKERKDLGPLELLSAVSGHPIPLETFKVTLVSAQARTEQRLPTIRKDSPSGWARIDWIQ